MQPELFALAVAAVIFAGISKGGFGSGASFASAAILALALPPAAALGIMLPLLMLIDLATLRPYWRRWAWPESKLLILGGVPGVAIGALLYTLANDDMLRFLIGSVALGFVAFRIWPRRRSSAPAMPDWGGLLSGAIAGFTSFVSHAGGPPAAVFLLSRGLGKTEYQASTVLVFWVINIAKFIRVGTEQGLVNFGVFLFDQIIILGRSKNSFSKIPGLGKMGWFCIIIIIIDRNFFI